MGSGHPTAKRSLSLLLQLILVSSVTPLVHMVMGLFAVYASLGKTFTSVPEGTAISELTINAQCMGTVVHQPLIVLCNILLSRF